VTRKVGRLREGELVYSSTELQLLDASGSESRAAEAAEDEGVVGRRLGRGQLVRGRESSRRDVQSAPTRS
jgi:hypothetical protein